MTDGLFSRLSAEAQHLISPNRDLALRCSPDPFVRDVLELSPAPLILARVPGLDGKLPITADALQTVPGLDMVIDSGPTPWGQVSTIVRIDDDRWTIEREGAIAATSLTQMSGLIILFVCTGNTCRSPMAEALCKLILAHRLDCAVEQLEERGYVILSAGVAAMGGARPPHTRLIFSSRWGDRLRSIAAGD